MAIFQSWLVNLFFHCVVFEFITSEALRLSDVVSRVNSGFLKISHMKDKNADLIHSIHCAVVFVLFLSIPPSPPQKSPCMPSPFFQEIEIHQNDFKIGIMGNITRDYFLFSPRNI